MVPVHLFCNKQSRLLTLHDDELDVRFLYFDINKACSFNPAFYSLVSSRLTMKYLSDFAKNRLDPHSFSARLEWCGRQSLSFLLSGLFALYFEEFVAIPFLLPILVLVVSNSTFGETMKVSRALYRGSILVCLLSTGFYYVPYINQQHWYLTLLYFFIVSLFLTVTLHQDAAAIKLSLCYHVIFALALAYKEELNYPVSEIWKSWLLVICISSCF